MKTLDIISRSKPIAEQVQGLLRERIQRGIYPAGQRMPSEERLAEELGVSRATMRTALAALATQGLVLRRHGDGTYPAQNVLELSVRAVEAWNIERQIQQSGRAASTQVLEHGFRPVAPQEQAALSLGAGEHVFAIRRLFLADETPVMLAIHVLRGEGLAPDFPPEAVQLSLLEFLSRYYQPPLQVGQVLFKAVLAEAGIAAALAVQPGSPLLLLEAHLKDSQDRPLLLALEYYRGEEGFLLPVAPFHTQSDSQERKDP